MLAPNSQHSFYRYSGVCMRCVISGVQKAVILGKVIYVYIIHRCVYNILCTQSFLHV